MSNVEIVTALVAALVGAGGVIAWVKLPREGRELHIKAADTTVQAAGQVVVIQSREIERLAQVVDELREDFDSAQQLAEVLKVRVADLSARLAGLTLDLEKTRQQRDELAAENAELKMQVAHLERRVRELENGTR